MSANRDLFLPLSSLALFAALSLPDTAYSQCQLATRDLYGTGNPVTLDTEWPGQYLVPGTLTHFDAQNTMTGVALLAMNTQAANLALGGVIGDLLVDPVQPLTLPGIGASTHWTISSPNNLSLLGNRYYFQSFHEQSGTFFASNGVDLRMGNYTAEIAVTGIQLPGNVIGGNGPRPFVVTFENHGPAPANFQVDLTIGGPGGTYGFEGASVPGFGTGSVTVWAPIPPAFGAAGSSVPFTVVAGTAFLDCNPNNNQSVTNLPIAVPYWDLHVQLLGAPNSVFVPWNGIWINYQVRVRNEGNVASGNYGMFTQINCSPGQGNYGCTVNAPINFWNSPPVAAGSSTTRNVSYFVPGNVWRQTQWLKAEISSGDTNLAGNFTERAITFF